MKVLHLIHAYFPAIGGSEYLMQQVSEYLADTAGTEVTVFTTFAGHVGLFSNRRPAMSEPAAEEVINGVNVRRFPVIGRWTKPLYLIQYILYRLRFPGNGFWRMLYYGPISPRMKKAVRDFDADVIVSAPFPLNHMNYAFKNKRNVPAILVGCLHTSDRHGFHNPRIKKMVRRARGVIALTPHEKDFLVKDWGIAENKVEVIGVGIDTRRPPVKNNRLKETLDFGPQDPVIAFVGQHGLHKGIKTLIHAMPMVWQEFPAARLIVAGGATPFTAAFKKLAESLDKSGDSRICFMDNVVEDRKYEILEACDIFASPSGFESFGITILEAWSRKKPVVVCDIASVRHLVRDGETGFTVPYKNSRQLAETLVRLIKDPQLRKKTGEQGYRKLINNYSKEIIGEKYRRFYGKIVGHEKKN